LLLCTAEIIPVLIIVSPGNRSLWPSRNSKLAVTVFKTTIQERSIYTCLKNSDWKKPELMSKTLVIILNHNIPEYANQLYDSLKNYQGETYDALVMDNGSKPELMPATTHIRFEQNLYWGGALNEAFRIVLKDDKYDSLLFLNNDIEVTGEVFVNLLRHEMFSNDFVIISPCIAGWEQP
jgi:hypothetical protein